MRAAHPELRGQRTDVDAPRQSFIDQPSRLGDPSRLWPRQQTDHLCGQAQDGALQSGAGREVGTAELESRLAREQRARRAVQPRWRRCRREQRAEARAAEVLDEQRPRRAAAKRILVRSQRRPDDQRRRDALQRQSIELLDELPFQHQAELQRIMCMSRKKGLPRMEALGDAHSRELGAAHDVTGVVCHRG